MELVRGESELHHEQKPGKSVLDQYREVNVKITHGNNPDLANLAVPHYTEEEHETWAMMFAQQVKALPSRSSQEYIKAQQAIVLPSKRIPSLKEISDKLQTYTGWKLTRVEGLLPDREFFECLAQKLFPCTDFIRKRSEIEYTPSPDIFHDIFGHIPLITNTHFADFYEAYGNAALNANEEQLAKLQHIYWFTVEFGLIKNPEGTRIYGSGILSSTGEVFHALSDKVEVQPFNYDIVIKQPYEIYHMQPKLFIVDSFEWLLESFKEFAKKEGLLK